MSAYITKQQACKKLSVSLSTLNRYIQQGRIKAIKMGDSYRSAVRIGVDELDRFMCENQVK